MHTVKEHDVLAGLGGAVAEVVAGNGIGTGVVRRGFQDEYALIGPPTHLYRHYEPDAAAIESAAPTAMAASTSTPGCRPVGNRHRLGRAARRSASGAAAPEVYSGLGPLLRLEADVDTVVTPLAGDTGYPAVTAADYLTERRLAATVASAAAV